MRLALLGCDDDALTLVRAVTRSPEHRLVAAYETGKWRASLQLLAPGVVTDDPWESLMLESETDAVIVAADWLSEIRADQLRKLAQEGMPLLLVHPACSAIMALELDMIRRDTKCPMVAYFPGCGHALADGFRQATFQQLVFERSLSPHDRDSVLRQVARDMDLLRELLGDVQKVSATAATAANGDFITLDIHLSSGNETTARWSLAPSSSGKHAAASATLTAHGAEQVAVLSMPENEAEWQLTIDGEPANDMPRESADSATAALRALAVQCEQRATPNAVRDASAWPAICRDLEIVDAVERSLARGRTIELQTITVTEQDTFKGIMAAGSCLLLMALLLGLFLVVIFAGVRVTSGVNDSNSIVRYWPACFLVPLLLFLSLQLLQLVFPAKSPPAAAADDASEREAD